MRTYPLVSPIRFTNSIRGWRTSDELAEFLGLSRIGLNYFQHYRGHGLYGPRYTPKTTSAVPKGGYSDAEVAGWILRASMTEQSWLGYHQHTHPSETNKPKAKASIDSLIETYRFKKQ